MNPAAELIDPPSAPPYPIVAVGASAGGIEAVSSLLNELTPDTGMAFVVIVHRPPDRASALAEVLARESAMPVVDVADDTEPLAGRVYVAPPGVLVVLSGGRLRLAPLEGARARPIDVFMRSLAEEHGHKSIGVVLSGTGSDGARGLEEIKGAGGLTFAQDTSAQQDGMPLSAMATGAVDFVLPPVGIAAELARVGRHPFVMEESPAVGTGAFEEIVALLHQLTGVDFSHYKRTTLHRRITRRMVLHKSESATEYLEMLRANPAEAMALHQDVLIGVTSFFRNPEAYEALKVHAFPRIVEGRSRTDAVRVWALGCSTGEEAYSIAMAFLEYAEAERLDVPMHVFATDLNAAGIDRARSGIYPKGIAQDVSPERLRRFFVEVDGSYRVAKRVREMVVFARQNVLVDPPFSRVDLVACRNLLIYLDPVLQRRVIPLLHYALRDERFLWLGASETIGVYRDLFDAVDVRHKVYVKKRGPRYRLAMVQPHVVASVPEVPRTEAPRAPDGLREADRILIARYAPPGVVLGRDLEILQFRGDTSPFLSPAPGKASLNILKMVREGLAASMRMALQKAQREGVPVHEPGLRVRGDGGWREVAITVLPLRGGVEGGSLLVVFEEPERQLSARLRQREAEAVAASRVDEGVAAPADEVARLRQELAATRDYLQSVIEQQEAANEELQSANEEVQSANEELQSINEELETSKEEIQSSNEELATVNDELQSRNAELTCSHDDLANLLASVELPIVMVGADLRVRRFTPAAEKLLGLASGDIGRPVGHLASKLHAEDLEALVRESVDAISPRQREVQDGTGRWHSLRVRPYRTAENRIEGAVIVLVDVDDLKRAEAALREGDRAKNEFLATVAHELRSPLAGIRAAARLLAGARDAAVLDEARRIVERQSGHMLRMVDELLDLSRMTYGKIRIADGVVDLLAVLRDAIATTESNRLLAAQSFQLEAPSQPVWVRGDALRLDQVFSNLLHNASKFTQRGGSIWISVRLSRYGASAQVPGEVEVQVNDNGGGIDMAMLPRVFEAFVQGSGGAARGSGMGLGLALARQIVELHGGTIEARSAGAARGSQLVVRLPLCDDETARSATPRSAKGTRRPRRILVVDDNRDAAAAQRMLLEAAGHSVRVVHDGAAVLSTCAVFQPEVVLLDLSLPDADGRQVARELRAHEATAGALIVALTGFGSPEDVRRSIESGFDDHLVKPVDGDQLLDLIDRETR